MMKLEVHHGWQLPLPPAAVHTIPDAIVAPMGLVEQATINESGKIVDKLRVTHDQSYNLIKASEKGSTCMTNNFDYIFLLHSYV
jgi:hypothetical protein